MTGSLLLTIRNPTPAYGDWFGQSLNTVGGDILVGAPDDDTAGSEAGPACLFVPEPASAVLLVLGAAALLGRRR